VPYVKLNVKKKTYHKQNCKTGAAISGDYKYLLSDNFSKLQRHKAKKRLFLLVDCSCNLRLSDLNISVSVATLKKLLSTFHSERERWFST